MVNIEYLGDGNSFPAIQLHLFATTLLSMLRSVCKLRKNTFVRTTAAELTVYCVKGWVEGTSRFVGGEPFKSQNCRPNPFRH